MQFNWRGAEVAAKVELASRLGVDQTTGAAANHAKDHHPWHNVTGTLEGSLRMEPATLEGADVRGLWGSFDVAYAIWLEIGTSVMAAMPYLRPAADAKYPSLSGRIRENLAALP